MCHMMDAWLEDFAFLGTLYQDGTGGIGMWGWHACSQVPLPFPHLHVLIEHIIIHCNYYYSDQKGLFSVVAPSLRDAN